jgi:hypothetical protein
VTSLWRWTEENGIEIVAQGTVERRFTAKPSGTTGRWLSSDGSVLVGDFRSADGRQSEVYRWTEASGFEVLPGIEGRPNASVKDITPDGKWVFGRTWTDDNLGHLVPFLWSEETGALNLHDVFQDQGLGPAIEGWDLTKNLGVQGAISADGRAIIGAGINPDGQIEGWVAYLDPISVEASLPGDYNANGQVEQGDLDLVLLNWGSDGVPAGWKEDLPNGTIDQEEIDTVLLAWGDSLPVPFATPAVPEPLTAVLLFLAVALITATHKTSRSRTLE